MPRLGMDEVIVPSMLLPSPLFTAPPQPLYNSWGRNTRIDASLGKGLVNCTRTTNVPVAPATSVEGTNSKSAMVPAAKSPATVTVSRSVVRKVFVSNDTSNVPTAPVARGL